MHFRGVVVFELVDFLLGNDPALADLRAGRMLRVLVQAFHADLRAVMLKLAAEHVNVAGPMVKGVARGVNADEGVSLPDPVEQSLRVGYWQISGRAGENHAVVILQRFRRKLLQRCFQGFLPFCLSGIESRLFLIRRVPLQVGGLAGWLLHQVHGELAAVLAKLGENLLQGGDGAMPETGRGGHHEQFFGRRVQGNGRKHNKQEGGNRFHFDLFRKYQGSSGGRIGRTQMLRNLVGLLWNCRASGPVAGIGVYFGKILWPVGPR